MNQGRSHSNHNGSLSQSVGIVLMGEPTRWLLDHGTPLPARKGVDVRTLHDVYRGQVGNAIQLEIVEKTSAADSSSRQVACFTVPCSQIGGDLPAGSEIEITLGADRVGNLQVKLYIPKLDEVYEFQVGELGIQQRTSAEKTSGLPDTTGLSDLVIVDCLKVDDREEKGRIELCVGDVTELRAHDAVDVLVVSAFPNCYGGAPGSLIAALERKGVSVSNLAKRKAADLRQVFSCWMSSETLNPQGGIHFRRILCFEPPSRGTPGEFVGDIFRSLAPFVGEDPPVKTVAMPLVASGYQGVDSEQMLRLLVEAAVRWMRIGMPLSCLKIACLPGTSVEALKKVFQELKQSLSPAGNRPKDAFLYDVFVSYAHVDADHVAVFEKGLRNIIPNVRLFIDKSTLNHGSAWQQEIFESLDDCRKVVVFLTPSYLRSKVCLEEFNIALCRNREADSKVLAPIYLYTANLPTYMRLIQFWDCREFDPVRLETASALLARELAI